MIRRRVVVTGVVQGVFFRDGCRREARRLGVTGWVTNRSDGSVEGVFEGDAAAVEQMVAWVRQGPPRATIESVEVLEEAPAGELEFRVR